MTHSVHTTMKPGTGKIIVSGKCYLDYFPTFVSRSIVISPFHLSGTFGLFDTLIEVDQEADDHWRHINFAHCVAMSIAVCLGKIDNRLQPCFKPVFKRQFNPEYKKAGKRNSRARYTWRKR